MGTKFWTPENVARLLACDTAELRRRETEDSTSPFYGKSERTLRNQYFAQRKAANASAGATTATETEALAADVPVPGLVPLAQYNRVLRQRDDAKNKISEYVAALKAAVFEAMEDVIITPPRQRRIDPKAKIWAERTEEIACLDIGDWQLGKVTPTYNSAICEERIKLLAEKVIELAKIQNAHHPVRKLHLRGLGDIVEGEGIFPTQAHVIDSGLYRQIANGIRILVNLILDLLNYFDEIHFVGVIGNHGSVRIAVGTTDPETNMDRLLYMVVRELLVARGLGDRVTFDIPDGPGERNWFAVDRVFEWGFLLCHGDQIRGGFAGFPFYGTAKKTWGWIDSIEEPWDYLHFGHWHTPTMQTLNKRIVRCNGSTESDNTYAQEQLAAIGSPTQWLGFVHPDHGITAEYWVSLADNRKPNLRRYLDYGSERPTGNVVALPTKKSPKKAG
jgi:hypothetical protein